MKQYSLLLLLLLFCTATWSQDRLSRRDSTLMQTLGMNLQDYQSFSKAIKDLDQKIVIVQKDNTLSFEEKKRTLENLHQQEQQYIATHLSPDQQNELKAYYQAYGHHSAAFLKRQQQMEKLKQNEVKRKG